MLRPRKLSLVTARRTLRALYAQTQGYPYGAKLNTAGSARHKNNSNNQSAFAAFGQSSGVANVFPGAVLTRSPGASLLGGETLDLAAANDVPFGLSANFVGGDLDDLVDNTEIGAWRGSGSVWVVLAPVFDPAVAATDNTLVSDANGRLAVGATAAAIVGRLIDKLGTNAIVVDLLIP